MLFTGLGRSVWEKKLCPWSWVRPEAVLKTSGTVFFPIRTSRPVNNIYISIGWNGVELQVTLRKSNFPPHDLIWSKLRGFKRKNNECVRNGEKANLHKIKIVVFFLILHVWCYDAYFVMNMSLRRHKDVIHDNIGVIASHMRNQKKPTILILCRFVFSPLRTQLLFSRLNSPNFDHILSCGGKFEYL